MDFSNLGNEPSESEADRSEQYPGMAAPGNSAGNSSREWSQFLPDSGSYWDYSYQNHGRLTLPQLPIAPECMGESSECVEIGVSSIRSLLHSKLCPPQLATLVFY